MSAAFADLQQTLIATTGHRWAQAQTNGWLLSTTIGVHYIQLKPSGGTQYIIELQGMGAAELMSSLGFTNSVREINAQVAQLPADDAMTCVYCIANLVDAISNFF